MSEGAKISPEGKILLLPNSLRDAVCLKHGESFALCGARLKKLFEKSFFRIFKNFQHAIVVKLSKSFEKRKMSF